jgi:NH3-dependent NAD+ synthetase
MDKKLNYETVFDTLVKKTQEYVESNHLKAMILGISGGIDSTVVAAICHEVSKKTGIPLIGRSLPIYKHADATFNESILVIQFTILTLILLLLLSILTLKLSKLLLQKG